MEDKLKKSYVIHGDPIPLARARFGKNKRIYDSQKHLKIVWGVNLSRLHGDDPLFQGPLFMEVTFYMKIAESKSYYHRKKLQNKWHVCRPDASNLLKWIEDIGTGIIYHDDCLIAKVLVEKCYDDGNGPRTEFTISNLREKDYGVFKKEAE